MANVVVPQAKEKEDPTAKLMTGLQLAGGVYGIKNSMAEAEKNDAIARRLKKMQGADGEIE